MPSSSAPAKGAYVGVEPRHFRAKPVGREAAGHDRRGPGPTAGGRWRALNPAANRARSIPKLGPPHLRYQRRRFVRGDSRQLRRVPGTAICILRATLSVRAVHAALQGEPVWRLSRSSTPPWAPSTSTVPQLNKSHGTSDATVTHERSRMTGGTWPAERTAWRIAWSPSSIAPSKSLTLPLRGIASRSPRGMDADMRRQGVERLPGRTWGLLCVDIGRVRC